MKYVFYLLIINASLIAADVQENASIIPTAFQVHTLSGMKAIATRSYIYLIGGQSKIEKTIPVKDICESHWGAAKIKEIAFNKEGTRLAGAFDDNAFFYTKEDGSINGSAMSFYEGCQIIRVRSIAWNSDSSTILTLSSAAHGESTLGGYKLEKWDSFSGISKEKHLFGCTYDRVPKGSFSPDASKFLTATFWKGKRALEFFLHSSDNTSELSTILVSCPDALSIKKCGRVAWSQEQNKIGFPIQMNVFGEKGHCDQNVLVIWDMKENSYQKIRHESGKIKSLKWIPDQNLLAAVSTKSIVLYNSNDGTHCGVYPLTLKPGHCIGLIRFDEKTKEIIFSSIGLPATIANN